MPSADAALMHAPQADCAYSDSSVCRHRECSSACAAASRTSWQRGSLHMSDINHYAFCAEQQLLAVFCLR